MLTLPTILILMAGPIGAYLLGSIPFGLLIGFMRGVDLRTRGSGNIGASNLGRVLGRRYFWFAFILDALKGFLPVLACDLVAHRLHLTIWAVVLTALAAVLGHIFPVYLKFRGGKGVATTFGAMLGIWPAFTMATLAALGVFVLVLLVYRYISLASILAAAALPPFVALAGRFAQVKLLGMEPQRWRHLLPLVGLAAMASLLIIMRHRSNIKRLLTGAEAKVGERTSEPAAPQSQPKG